MTTAENNVVGNKVSAQQFRKLIDRASDARDSLVSCQENEVLRESEIVHRAFELLRAARLKRENPELERQRVNMFGTMLRSAQFRLNRLRAQSSEG